MKKTIFAALGLIWATVTTNAQQFSAADLARRTIERRAVEAAIGAMMEEADEQNSSRDRRFGTYLERASLATICARRERLARTIRLYARNAGIHLRLSVRVHV
jgi:hypothetical protein